MRTHVFRVPFGVPMKGAGALLLGAFAASVYAPGLTAPVYTTAAYARAEDARADAAAWTARRSRARVVLAARRVALRYLQTPGVEGGLYRLSVRVAGASDADPVFDEACLRVGPENARLGGGHVEQVLAALWPGLAATFRPDIQP